MGKSWATIWKPRRRIEQAGSVFYDIAFGKNAYYKHQGWLSGRVTTDDNFTFYVKPELDENAQNVPEGDFVAQPDAGMYYVSVDFSGKLGWKSCTLTYGDTTAHVLEILTGKASNANKAFLRRLGISYSWSNSNIERVSKMFQKATGTDMVQIETVVTYTGSYKNL